VEEVNSFRSRVSFSPAMVHVCSPLPMHEQLAINSFGLYAHLVSLTQLFAWRLVEILMIVRSTTTSSSSATPLETTTTSYSRSQISFWARPKLPQRHANCSSLISPSPTEAATPTGRYLNYMVQIDLVGKFLCLVSYGASNWFCFAESQPMYLQM
jgi:hypothetical protein